MLQQLGHKHQDVHICHYKPYPMMMMMMMCVCVCVCVCGMCLRKQLWSYWDRHLTLTHHYWCSWWRVWSTSIVLPGTAPITTPSAVWSSLPPPQTLWCPSLLSAAALITFLDHCMCSVHSPILSPIVWHDWGRFFISAFTVQDPFIWLLLHLFWMEYSVLNGAVSCTWIVVCYI